MTNEQLQQLLEGEDLAHSIDVRTLVLDELRQADNDRIMALFWELLPQVDDTKLQRYFYMKRS